MNEIVPFGLPNSPGFTGRTPKFSIIFQIEHSSAVSHLFSDPFIFRALPCFP
jgi:hypothetical protein